MKLKLSNIKRGLTSFLFKKIIIAKSKEVKTGWQI
jgi:hypothetical protein